MDDLKKLYQEIMECKNCRLLRNGKIPVFGEGPATAKIMFIGEAPGLEEDLHGKPFVGDAGKFLNELLTEAGLKRQEVFITNVVKWRSPFNRMPNKNEIEACKPHLLKEIKIIKPKLIVLLGNTALKTLVEKKLTVSKAHGKPVHKNLQKYFLMYHPAAVLYNPKLKETMVEDARKLRKIIKSIS